MQEKNFKPDELERFERETGFTDFSTINALRVASRKFVSYAQDGSFAKDNLATCIEKRQKPYVVAGYFIAQLYVSNKVKEASDMTLLEEEKPKANYLLFWALKEYMCGEWIERHIEGLPPFMLKLQAVKPLMLQIQNALRSEEAKEFRNYPWAVFYYGKLAKAYNQRNLFRVGFMKNEKPIQELPEFPKIKRFKELLIDYGLRFPNGLIAITPDDFDKAYKEAFAEELDNWRFIRQQENEAIEESDTDESQEDLDYYLDSDF